jgi:hypothetical protein
MKPLTEILDSYIDAYRNLINKKIWDSKKEIVKTLRLQKPKDWDFICASMDILDDALLAIENFLNFGLGGPTKYEPDGEKYLRLYGVLNATYLQQYAILELYIKNNLSNPRSIKGKIKRLKINEIRHKLGAHSVNHKKDPKQTDTECFVPTRFTLAGFNCEFTNNKTSEREKIDLKDTLNEHLSFLIETIDLIYEKSAKTFYQKKPKKIDEYLEILKDLRIEKNGGLVLNKNGPRKIILTTNKRT